jgi:maltose alpha-D-glucosyltransferase/alpha-amylase
MSKKTGYAPEHPLWFKDAIIYEVHVKSFFDSNDDGIGDFRGLTQKLDYLAGLGVTAVWLLPFYPSPLRDDGYDIADYYRVHPDYGTLADFRRLLREAHRRELKIITELVINHTSDQHPWFQRSRKAPKGSPNREFYVWSDDPDRYGETRIIFKDYESSNWSWDPVAEAYYWHRFYAHQPDLNFDNPEVRREILRVLDFWFDMGVDGMRLDAIPYLIEREGTNCENLPETHAVLKTLRSRIDKHHRNRMFLAEANQWPEDAVAYFGDGDECHMCFHFPVMPRLYMALTMEDRFPIVDIMDQTPAIPANCQWAMFLRNHDELTLEMVTDEERDYMYRVYAQDPKSRLNLGIRRRLAPLLGNDRRKIELLNSLLFSFPGTPILYYGDEIGMGDNFYLGDRDGVRTPMQWSADRNAGFSRCNPQRLYLPVIIDSEYHFEALNVENQEKNLSSLLWWMKRLIGVRKSYPALGGGDMQFVLSDNPHILSFTRSCDEQTILVAANLSHYHQVAELDLEEYAGLEPVEMFSQNTFPAIRSRSYRIILGPYGYLWLLLKHEAEELQAQEEQELPELRVRAGWRRVLAGSSRQSLERKALRPFLERARWFAGKVRGLRGVKIVDVVSLNKDSEAPVLLLIEPVYPGGSEEWYLLPLDFAAGEKALEIMEKYPQGIVSRIYVDDSYGVLYDGLYSERLPGLILNLLRGRAKCTGALGQVTGSPGAPLKTLRAKPETDLSPRVLKAEQSNSSLLYGSTFFLKLYRKFEEGLNPEPEMIRYLTEQAGFEAVPSFAGNLEYRRKDREPLVLALLQQFVASQNDAWTLTLDVLQQYFERVLTLSDQPPKPRGAWDSLFSMDHDKIPEQAQALVGGVYLEQTVLLGRRTAEMHRALAATSSNSDFDPEPFSRLYQRSLYQSLRNRILRGMDLLEKYKDRFPEQVRKDAEVVLGARKRILDISKRVLDGKITGKKIRIHGDYHLGQLLFTGKDFLIIDFEGEPMRSPGERRLKYSALRDVAGILRSFHYAVYSALIQFTKVHPADLENLLSYAELWYQHVSAVFFSAYREAAGDGGFLPESNDQIAALLGAFLIDKGIYEIIYELNNRPEWVSIPIRGILSILTDTGVLGRA